MGRLAEASECERELLAARRHYEYWLADVAYGEAFLARMKTYRGKPREAIADLVEATARFVGIGLAAIVNALNPARIVVGGDIASAWDLVGAAVVAAMGERATGRVRCRPQYAGSGHGGSSWWMLVGGATAALSGRRWFRGASGGR